MRGRELWLNFPLVAFAFAYMYFFGFIVVSVVNPTVVVIAVHAPAKEFGHGRILSIVRRAQWDRSTGSHDLRAPSG